MQRPGSWLTVVAALVVVGGLALLARMLLGGDAANPQRPAPSPVTQAPAPTNLPAPVVAPPQGTRSEEPKPKAHPESAEQGPPGRILGRVVDPNHEPVANAEVELVQGPAVMMQLRQLASETGIVANTDAKGEYRLAEVPPADDYIVYASHPDFGDSEAGPIVVHASAEARVGDIVLRVGAHVSGHVNADGRPLEGAIVTISNQMDVLRKMRPTPPSSPDQRELKLSTHTDASGSYAFASVPFDNFELTAEASGFARISKSTQNVFGATPREQTVDFEMLPAVAIRGRVVDDKKNALAGALVKATVASTTFRCEQAATSDAAGAFLLDALAQGQYFIMAECDGYSSATKPQVEAGGSDIEIQLQVQGGVTGVVVDDETGAPVVDFDLTVMQSLKNRGPVPARVHFHGHDPAGRFELKNVDPGLFQLQGKAAGYAESLSDEFQVVRGQVTPSVRVPMNRGGTVTGAVADKSGRPLANAVVILRTNKMVDTPINAIFKNVSAGDPEQKVRTDGDGRFKIELVVPGTYQLAARQDGFAPLEQNDVEVRRKETTDAGKLVLSQGAKVRGHVYGLDGKPLAGAVVNAVTKSSRFLTALADNDGAFVITAMPPGDYTLTIAQFASTPPIGALEMIIMAKNSQAAVTLADGDDTSVDLHLTKK
jgi:protocatechuate 3,4-dioxygenase beta subunit